MTKVVHGGPETPGSDHEAPAAAASLRHVPGGGPEDTGDGVMDGHKAPSGQEAPLRPILQLGQTGLQKSFLSVSQASPAPNSVLWHPTAPLQYPAVLKHL